MKCVLQLPKKEMALLTKEGAISLTMDQDIIKEYTSTWKVIDIKFQMYEDDDSYIYIKTDRESVSKKKPTDTPVIDKASI